MKKMENQNLHKGHRERLRERARLEGLENFNPHQVLEYLLSFIIPRKDTNPFAHRLIRKFGSFSKVLDANEEDLKTVEGMGEVSANFLATFKQFYHYYNKARIDFKGELIKSPRDALKFLQPLFYNKKQEEAYIVCINNKNQVTAVEKVATGSLNKASIDIQKLLSLLIKFNCTNFIFSHNHPDGNSNPSEADTIFTKSLTITTSLSGIELMDHLIICDDTYFSYSEKSLLQDYRVEAKKLISSGSRYI